MPLWSANANFVAPEVLKDLHKHYLINGANAITTNSFATSECRLNKVGLGHLAKSLTYQSVKIACEARDEVKPDAVVLGCIVPMLQEGEFSILESCYKVETAPNFQACKDEHKKQVSDLYNAGVDFILFETFARGVEALAAAEIA